MLNKIEHVIFDLDGLLIDSERYMWAKNAKLTLEYLGYQYDPNFSKTLMGASHEVYKREIIKKYGQDFPINKYYQHVLELNDRTVENKEIPLMKGALELLTFLQQKHIDYCIGTSTPRQQAIKVLKNTGLQSYFTKMVCGDEVKNGKPSPDIYLKTLEICNSNTENSVVIEDGHSGFNAARSAGIECILVEDVAYVSDEDRQNAYARPNDLNEVIDIIKKINNIK